LEQDFRRIVLLERVEKIPVPYVDEVVDIHLQQRGNQHRPLNTHAIEPASRPQNPWASCQKRCSKCRRSARLISAVTSMSPTAIADRSAQAQFPSQAGAAFAVANAFNR
jgi:hypothetical protein